MKIIKTKNRIYNPVTGNYYPIYRRVREPGDKPIAGLWNHLKKEV